MSRHESHLASYLRSKKTVTVSLTSRSPSKSRLSEQPTANPSRSEGKKDVMPRVKGKANALVTKTTGSTAFHGSRLARRHIVAGGVAQGKVTRAGISLLPDELLVKIFRYLSPTQLLICAQVCHRWTALTRDSCLWENRFSSFPKEVRNLFSFEETRKEGFDWKKETVRRCVAARNNKILSRRKKIKSYTGLAADVESSLRTLSIVWKLCFTDTRGQQYWVSADDTSYFASSASVRWYSLPVPPLPRLESFAMYACVPVFFNRSWKPHLNSATTKSLILVHNFKGSFSKETLSNKDELVTAHILPQALLASCWEVSWKNGGELAFITSCIHYNNLLRKVLLGKRNEVYRSPPHVPILDDIDPQYGLHGYSATVELRNHKATYWGHQYRELFQNEVCGDCVTLGSYGREHGVFPKRVNLPWKTELFRGILPNLVILDVTVLDERKEPMWLVSAPVKVEPITEAEVDYLDGREGNRYSIHYSDSQGSVCLELVWAADEGETAIVNVELRILKSFVNRWFGTSY